MESPLDSRPGPADVGATPARVVVRTVLLAVSAVLLFPALLDRATHGAWPRLMTSIGVWRWVLWAACFVAMTITRFSGGPRRGA